VPAVLAWPAFPPRLASFLSFSPLHHHHHHRRRRHCRHLLVLAASYSSHPVPSSAPHTSAGSKQTRHRHVPSAVSCQLARESTQQQQQQQQQHQQQHQQHQQQHQQQQQQSHAPSQQPCCACCCQYRRCRYLQSTSASSSAHPHSHRHHHRHVLPPPPPPPPPPDPPPAAAHHPRLSSCSRLKDSAGSSLAPTEWRIPLRHRLRHHLLHAILVQQPVRFKLGGRPVLSAHLNVETAGSEPKRP
jgi:hypothetical protein